MTPNVEQNVTARHSSNNAHKSQQLCHIHYEIIHLQYNIGTNKKYTFMYSYIKMRRTSSSMETYAQPWDVTG